jgi:hypothetical protein
MLQDHHQQLPRLQRPNSRGHNLGLRQQHLPFSTRSTIGEATAQTLLHPEKRANQYLCISTLETCQNDILALLKRVTGDVDWKVTHVLSEEKIKQGKEMIEKGQFLKGSGTLALAAAYGGCYGEDF